MDRELFRIVPVDPLPSKSALLSAAIKCHWQSDRQWSDNQLVANCWSSCSEYDDAYDEDDTIRAAHAAFDAIDKNGDGFIDREGSRQRLRGLHPLHRLQLQSVSSPQMTAAERAQSTDS